MGEPRVADASLYRLVLVTTPVEVAPKLAQTLVSERLAGCVNQIGPVRSVYWWRGGLENDEEVLLVVKTTVSLLPKILERLQEIHPYEIPEFIALPISEGSAEYLNWLASELDAHPSDGDHL